MNEAFAAKGKTGWLDEPIHVCPFPVADLKNSEHGHLMGHRWKCPVCGVTWRFAGFRMPSLNPKFLTEEEWTREFETRAPVRSWWRRLWS